MPDADASEFNAAVDIIHSDFERRFGTPTLPLPGQDVAVTLLAPKSAALYFDRVWAMPEHASTMPPGIAAYGATPVELWIHIVAVALLSGIASEEDVADVFENNEFELPPPYNLPAERAIAEALYIQHNVDAVPLLQSEDELERQYQPGAVEVIAASMSSLAVVSESALSWQQVTEFRADKEACRKYRRLINWLDESLVGKSGTIIADEIARRLSDYDWAIRKHGLQAAAGALTALIDPRFLASAGVAVAGATLVNHLSAVFAATSLAVAQVGLSVVRSLIDLNEAKRAAAAEIAFVIEVRDTFRS
jgi:hypothetical protein